jgi:hypothetical protein
MHVLGDAVATAAAAAGDPHAQTESQMASDEGSDWETDPGDEAMGGEERGDSEEAGQSHEGEAAMEDVVVSA